MEGRRAFSQGRLNTALARIDSAARLAPDLADIPYLRGLVYADMDRFAESREAFRRTLELDPYYPGAAFQLGHLDFRDLKYRSALEHYRQEAELVEAARKGRVVVPDMDLKALPAIKVQIGRAYARLVETEKALQAYREALALDSTFVPALLDLAQLYDSGGDPRQARAFADRAHRYAPENVDVRYLLGRIHLTDGNLDEAVSHLEAVAEARPWNPGAAYNLGRAFLRSGNDDRAETFFERADSLQTLYHEIDQARTQVHQQPEHPGRWMELASLLDRAGRTAEARQAATVARSLNEGSKEESR